MDREQQRDDLINFLKTIQRPDYLNEEIDEHSNMIQCGLIDSLALLQIIAYLEQAYNLDFRERGVDPGDLLSVNGILDLIAREAAA